MKIRSRALLGVAAMLLAAATSTACASDTDAGQQGTMRVGLSSKSPTMLALYAAVQNGYFAEEGVTVPEPTILPSGAKLAAAIVGGSVDVGIGVMPDVVNLAETGKPVKLVGAVYPSYYVDIVVGNGITTPPGADLATKIKMLQGKKIGITGPGSGTEALVTFLFAQVGLDAAKDAELVSLGSDPSAAINALRSGQVDALSHILSVGQQAEKEGIGHIAISPGRGDVPALTGALHGVAFTLQPTIDNQRADLVKFLRALQRGMDFVRQDPKGAREILAQQFSGTPPAVLDGVSSIVSANTATSLTVDPHGYDVEARMLSETRLTGTPPALASILAGDVIQEVAGTPRS